MKKLLSLCLVFVLAITFSASSFGGYYEGDTPKDPIQSSSAHDDYEPFINTGAIPATPAERAETALDAMRPRQHSAFYRANLPRSVQGWYNVPDMTYYAQETDYTCGAASLRMALDYFNGINYSESSIYSGANGTSGVGLTQSQVRTYINKKQSKYDYTGYDEQTQDNATITKILYTSIANEQVPPILGVKEVKSSGWPFNLSAHFVAAHSIASDKSRLSMLDPWGGYVGGGVNTECYDLPMSTIVTGLKGADVGYIA